MPYPIVVVDRSEVREGRLEDLKSAAKGLAEFVIANEPRPYSYTFYFDEDATHMTVLQVHPDSASMEEHMSVAADQFPPFAELLEMRSMEVSGDPSEALLERLRRKADMLGTVSLTVHRPHAGFARFAER
ncbi:MAG TPA: hypothetical protein VE646_01855 [Actinomycetota bacterium]|jgi:hypothetical protein|nr:hypothetical protein [Actinomycetota bacterium]